jgi:hypothetical protein
LIEEFRVQSEKEKTALESEKAEITKEKQRFCFLKRLILLMKY